MQVVDVEVLAVVVRARVVELRVVMAVVAESAIVARSGSRPRNQGRLPPHLLTGQGRSLRTLETSPVARTVVQKKEKPWQDVTEEAKKTGTSRAS